MEKKKTVENLFKSLDGIQKASAPDFFYAKLMARMERELVPEKPHFFMLRPAFLTGVLGIFLLVNVFTFIRLQNKSEIKTTTNSGTAATLESFAADYQLKSEAVYE